MLFFYVDLYVTCVKTQSLNCQGRTEQATGELKRNRKCGGDLNVEVAIGRGRQEVEVGCGRMERKGWSFIHLKTSSIIELFQTAVDPWSLGH